MVRRALVLALVLPACGGSSRSAPPTPTGPPAALEATPASADDVIVAHVNDRPVWGSCVAAQAARGASRPTALDECIAFELMAQEAEARGLATDPEVVTRTRTALVSQLVAKEYEDKYNRPADFGPYWDRMLALNRRRIEHGEYRGSTYVRIKVAKNAPPEVEAEARALMEEVAAALAHERGLMPTHFTEAAEQIIGDRAKLDKATVPPYTRGGLDPPYEQALFALPEVGRVSGAFRTRWGWDVIAWTDHVPERQPSPDQVVAEALPEIKRRYFVQWTNQIADKLGIKPQLFDDNVALLEDVP
jgi:hypothetical protein